MTKNEIVTEIDVQCKQAKHTIRKALQMPKLATQQDQIEMHDELSSALLNLLRHPTYPEKQLAPKATPVTP